MIEVIHDFENPRREETIIPVHWFDERPKIRICLQFYSKNELESKRFTKKLKKTPMPNGISISLSCSLGGSCIL